MRYKLLIILILCFLASFPSCKKAPLTVGPIVTQTRELSDFTEVYACDNINLSLVRSDTCYIEITTGKNIIDNITTDISNGILKICNTTTCNWIRPYDFELHATLYFKDIKNFVFQSSGTLLTKNNYTGSLHNGEFYRFEIDGGSGDVLLHADSCNDMRIVYQYGTSRLNITGVNNKNISIYKRSFGILDARNFDTQSVNIISESTADCYINVSHILDATINNLGNIYYKGDPDSIQVTYGEFARGKLLPIQ